MSKRLLLLFSLSITALVQAKPLAISEAGDVYEFYDVESQIFKDGTNTQLIKQMIRVQAEDSKTTASQVRVQYNGATEAVEFLEAYTLNKGKKIPVERSAIEDREVGEARDYDKMRSFSVVFPQVEIGSKLYLSYRLNVKKPLMENRFSTAYYYLKGMAIEKSHIRLQSERDLFYHLEDPERLLQVRQKSPREVWIELKKVTTPGVQGEKNPYYHPQDDARVYFSTEKNWVAFFSDLATDYEKKIAAEIPNPKWLSSLKKIKSPEEQVRQVLLRMSREFRYFGDWRRHDGGLSPRSLLEIEKSAYGDCKDLSTYVTAVLRKLGISAHVGLVFRGENPYQDFPDYGLPSIHHFNHAIVRAQVSGQTLWLDPTNSAVSFKALPDVAGRPVWILTEGGGHMDRISPLKSENLFNKLYLDYSFNKDQTVDVSAKAELLDLASHRLANELLLTPKSEVLSGLLEYLSEDNEVLSYKWMKQPQPMRELKDLSLELSYVTGSVTYKAGKNLFFVFPDHIFEGPFFETMDRESTLRLHSEPLKAQTVRRLKKMKLAQTTPEVCVIQSPWMDIKREVKSENSDVIVDTLVDLKKPHIRKPEFRSSEFKKFQEQVKKCIYRSGILVEPLNVL